MGLNFGHKDSPLIFEACEDRPVRISGEGWRVTNFENALFGELRWDWLLTSSFGEVTAILLLFHFAAFGEHRADYNVGRIE